MASEVEYLFVSLFAIYMKEFLESFEVKNCLACSRTAIVASKKIMKGKIIENEVSEVCMQVPNHVVY